MADHRNRSRRVALMLALVVASVPAGASGARLRWPRLPAEMAPAARKGDPDAGAANNDNADGSSTPWVPRDGGSAFNLPVAERDDPYGPRPTNSAKLTIDEILRFARENPYIAAADANVEAMRHRVKKAKLAWLPIVDVTLALSPGVNIKCDDVQIQTVNAPADFTDFQFCRPPGDPQLDVQTVKGYFQQLGRAGVRFQMQLDTVIPLYTFGKIKNTRKAAEAVLAMTRFQRDAAAQEIAMRVQQAHMTLLLARESKGILLEAKKVVDRAHKRVTKDLGGDLDDFDTDPSAGDPSRDPDDLLKVELSALELEELMREALKVESLALSALWALAGKAAPRGFDVADTPLVPVQLEGGPEKLAHYKRLAAESRPEAKAAAAGVMARRAQERLARSNFLPDLGLTLSAALVRTNAADASMNTLYYQDGFNSSRVTAALALRWRFDFHNDAFDLVAARAELRAAENQRAAAELLLGREVEESYAEMVETAEVARIRDASRKRAWQLVISQEQKETVGGGSLTELLRQLEKWYRLRFSHVEAVANHNIAAAKLARAVGAPLWGNPAQPKPSDGKGAVSRD